jgi:hypothetical protein
MISEFANNEPLSRSLANLLDNCPRDPALDAPQRNIVFWRRGSLRGFTFPATGICATKSELLYLIRSCTQGRDL